MQSPLAAKQAIKFALQNLASENGHHTFEHICRHFSRQRIGVNILPSTGPVSAGGDQGRDFETFRVFTPNGEASKPMAFTCTIQKDDISSKIKEDVKKIQKDGTPVETIYYFTLFDLPKGQRAHLQKWAHEQHSVNLEIVDGEALAEQLAEKELFWIAEEFLKVPSEIYPPIEDADYQKVKEKWQHNKPATHGNYAEFTELKTSARRSLRDKNVKHDASFWVNKLEEYSNTVQDPVLQRKAAYEAIAVHIRSTRKLESKEDFIRKYFLSLKGGFGSTTEVQDALVVWSYSHTASQLMKVANLTPEELHEWRGLIEQYIEQRLKEKNPPLEKAYLYETKGRLLISNPYSNTIQEGLGWWLKLIKVIKKTPLFPLETFSDVLSVMVPIVGSYKEFSELTEEADTLLSKRVGGFTAADKCRDRALAFYKDGQITKAINELHKAKVNWFSEETLRGSLISMQLIAQWYGQLGLHYAAKYYALAIAFMAHRAKDESLKEFMPRGLAELAQTEYGQGDWVSALERLGFVLQAMPAYSPDLQNKISDQIFTETVFHTTNIIAVSEALGKPYGDFVNERVKPWGLAEWYEDLLPTARQNFASLPLDELMKKLKEGGLFGKPYSDADKKRQATWMQLGIEWTVRWSNDFLTTSKAEQLVAVLQILLADFASEDLYLLPTKVLIDIELSDGPLHLEEKHEKDSYHWIVNLPRSVPTNTKEIHSYTMDAFGSASAILSQVSLMPQAKMMKRIEDAMKKGITSKTFFVSSYEVMYRDITSKEIFTEALGLPPLSNVDPKHFVQPSHSEMEWVSTPLSKFSYAEETEGPNDFVKKRYERSIVPIRKTLKKLMATAEFRQVVKELREEGWKDWHILMPLGSIAVNYRVNASHPTGFKEMKERFDRELAKEEDDTSLPVPLSEFTKEEIKTHLFMSMPSTLGGLGLRINTNSMNRDALWKFVSERLNYWSDDVEHENLFD